MSEVVLSVKDVRLRLGDNQVLEGVDFEIGNRSRPGQPTGQVVGLLGPSGVGKTQLLRILAGLNQPDSGGVTGPGGKPFAPGTTGVGFQNYPLLAHRTVRSNLEVAGRAVGMPKAEAAELATTLL